MTTNVYIFLKIGFLYKSCKIKFDNFVTLNYINKETLLD